MTLPIAQLQQSIRQICNGLEPSPIELAEILWLAMQMGGELVTGAEPSESVSETLVVAEEAIAPAMESAASSILERSNSLDIVADVVLDPLTRKEQPSTEPSETINPVPVKMPEAAALSINNRRAIARALRPLLRKVPSQVRMVIDEEATVNRIIEEKICSPVVRPEPERWLELAIVIEVTSVLEVWRQTIEEFRHLLERHGAFRDVRTWQLQAVAGEKPLLFLQTTNGLQRQPRSPKELLDAGGRRLILFLSDCTSDGWRSGTIVNLLLEWSQENPVTIVQLLPYHYWERSALGYGYPVRLGARSPGALNRDWSLAGLSPRQQRRLQGGKKFPVITMQSRSIQVWAESLRAIGEQPTAGIVILDWPENSDTEGSLPPELTAEQLVQRFRNTASRQAQRLANVMAMLPVDWSVIRLIQKNLGQSGDDGLSETGALHLAEMVLSGLLIPATPKNGRQQYDFAPQVRNVLKRAIPISEAEAAGERVAEQVFDQFPQEVRDRVNKYIEERFEGFYSKFDALLVPEQDWGDTPIDVVSFAQVREETLRLWGGEYAELADKLKNLDKVPSLVAVSSVDRDALIPELQSIEFETVTLSFQPEVTLKLFRFDVATLEIQQPRFFWQGNEPRLKLKRRSAQAYQLIESLGNNVQLEMVQIPAGEFMMGSPKDEIDRYSDESPQHRVTVPEFFIGKYPITQAQWRSIAQQPPVARELNPDPSSFKGDQLPVEKVSWYEAVEFCQRLSKWTGQVYRLPSEAEWEYACRAGTKTPFHFGNTISTEVANYNGNYTYGQGIKGTYREKTTVVGSFKVANAFGLYDMHGNVWEWCQDHYHDSYTGAPADGSEWIDSDAKEDAFRMLRGGGWILNPHYCRSACRHYYNYPDDHYNFIGFRVVSEAARTS
jgi:formylglycine-generating enzyme required for sulfatase activity